MIIDVVLYTYCGATVVHATAEAATTIFAGQIDAHIIENYQLKERIDFLESERMRLGEEIQGHVDYCGDWDDGGDVIKGPVATQEG